MGDTMDAKSLSSEELQTLLVNNFENLSRQIDRLNESLKKTNEGLLASSNSSKELKDTVTSTNKIFEQVSVGVTNILSKIQGLELVSKLMSNLGGLGGLGGGGKRP